MSLASIRKRFEPVSFAAISHREYIGMAFCDFAAAETIPFLNNGRRDMTVAVDDTKNGYGSAVGTLRMVNVAVGPRK